MGTTTKGIPYPEDTDLVSQGAQAMKAIANSLDFTLVAQTDPNAITSASLLAAYPLGVSTMALSTTQATNGAWPVASSSSVWTFKPTAGLAVQYFYVNNFNTQQVFYRVLGASNGAWVQLATGATASGSASVPVNNAPTGNLSITFPAGRFTATPQLVACCESTSFFAAISGVSNTGATLWVRQYTGASSTTTVITRWIASVA